MTEFEHDSASAAEAPHRDHEVVSHLPDGVAVVDASGSIDWANERLTAWCAAGDLRGRDFLVALAGWSADHRPDEVSAFHEALLGGRAAASTPPSCSCSLSRRQTTVPPWRGWP